MNDLENDWRSEISLALDEALKKIQEAQKESSKPNHEFEARIHLLRDKLEDIRSNIIDAMDLAENPWSYSDDWQDSGCSIGGQDGY